MSAVLTPTAPAPASIPWLLAGALIALAPLAVELPVWISATFLVSVLWRFGIDRWRLPAPGRLLRSLLAIAAIVFVFQQYGTLLGRDPGVALLVLLTGFKLLELSALRDAVLATLLLFLMLLGSFLFGNSLPLGGYTLIAVVAITAVLVRIQQPRLGARATLRLAAIVVAQALPIMLVTYVLFPRLSGPLWGLPSSGAEAVTGMSEEMRPGSVSALNSSDAVAFRAYFDEDATPRSRELYWRVYVLWDTDGQKWQIGPTVGAARTLRAGSPPVAYRLVLEPADKPWLPVLDLPVTVPRGLRVRDGHVYESFRPRRERQTLAFASVTRYQTGEASEHELRRALALPPISERVRALAQNWRAEARTETDVARAALAHFHREAFVYTLTPPALGSDPVDEFLFETRRGFCEHYSAAFVTLMRAAGVPARVVIGYQGGMYNPQGNYYLVRQADAHAWAEIWTKAGGWTRVDPTAAIAPSRVEYGIDAVRRLEAQGLPLLGLDGEAMQRAIALPWLQRALLRARLTWDYANLSWYRWVSGYDLERQTRLLESVGLTNRSIALLVMVALQLALLWTVFRWRARERRDAVQRLYDDYCRKLARAGIRRSDAEGPLALRVRAERARPELSSAIARITDLYVALRYGKAANSTRLAELAAAVRAFRPARR